MRFTQLFTKTRKTPPANEPTVNARLLVQAGYVNKLMAGVYSYLPLGLRVLRKIENIIRFEMDSIGGQEVFLPALQPSENWKKTSGWNSIDVLFKLQSRTKKEYALGQSHEEVITPLIKEYVSSYKDLPVFVYQIQNKYRDELRAKSGILRGREFGMKDLYSFHLDQDDFDQFYEKIKKAYLKVFSSCNLQAKVTEASGGAFSQKISYEFMVLTEAGEDDILYCPKCDYCVNLEIAKVKKGAVCPACRKGKLDQARASEVGNVFDLGQKYPKAFDFYLMNGKGKKVYPIMGCYGIGTSRLMGVIVEKHHDQKGIVWPESVAPFACHLVLVSPEKNCQEFAQNVYRQLQEKGIEVFYDDRKNISAGEKFADADLLGIPYRLIVSAKTTKENKVEVKRRNSLKAELLTINQLLKKLTR